MLRDNRFDWVTITSPEAATVFREGWLAADQPPVQIAAVGTGTGKALSSMEASGALAPAFRAINGAPMATWFAWTTSQSPSVALRKVHCLPGECSPSGRPVT